MNQNQFTHSTRKKNWIQRRIIWRGKKQNKSIHIYPGGRQLSGYYLCLSNNLIKVIKNWCFHVMLISITLSLSPSLHLTIGNEARIMKSTCSEHEFDLIELECWIQMREVFWDLFVNIRKSNTIWQRAKKKLATRKRETIIFM